MREGEWVREREGEGERERERGREGERERGREGERERGREGERGRERERKGERLKGFDTADNNALFKSQVAPRTCLVSGANSRPDPHTMLGLLLKPVLGLQHKPVNFGAEKIPGRPNLSAQKSETARLFCGQDIMALSINHPK